jgi:CYTH domain-containing protein
MALVYLGTAADVSGRRAKYARIERERRFLLREFPPGLERNAKHTQIFDNYITDTRLRLRKIREPYRREWTWKLTQKFAPDPADFSHTLITNIYLSQFEYEQLAVFEGNELRKNRYPYEHEGRAYSIDVFLGTLWGLILAEIEFATDEEMASLTPPPFAVLEVTNDELFTGGRLVQLTSDEIRAELLRRGEITAPTVEASTADA